MELYALSHCQELAQRWPEYDFSQVLILYSRIIDFDYCSINRNWRCVWDARDSIDCAFYGYWIVLQP